MAHEREVILIIKVLLSLSLAQLLHQMDFILFSKKMDLFRELEQ